MKFKIQSHWIVITIGIGAMASCFLFVIFSSRESLPNIGQQGKNLIEATLIDSTQKGDPLGESMVGLPVRLKIPKIKIVAPIEYVGLTPQGDMDVPKGLANVGWYDQGSRPGVSGSAVIDGHFGWRKGVPSIFNNLHTLQRGDKVFIEDNKGVVITFIVRESKSYDPKADASEVFMSHDGNSYLNLITCEGVWDEVSKSYSKRLVVFTDREEE